MIDVWLFAIEWLIQRSEEIKEDVGPRDGVRMGMRMRWFGEKEGVVF